MPSSKKTSSTLACSALVKGGVAHKDLPKWMTDPCFPEPRAPSSSLRATMPRNVFNQVQVTNVRRHPFEIEIIRARGGIV